MELFREDGHLTAEGLSAIVDGTLDELQSLEAAEHLSFCDTCLTKYTLLLQDGTLLQPASPIKEPVMQRLKTRSRRILFSKYGTIAAAACLAVTVWFVGNLAFSNQPVTTPEEQPVTHSEHVPLNERLNQTAQNFSNAADQFFGNLFGGDDDTAPSTVSQAQQRDEANRQREAVFNKESDKQEQKDATSQNTPSDASSQASKE